MILAPEKREALADVVSDPVSFGERFFRRKYWSKQKEILRSVALNANTAVKACHASSKTFSAADIALWFLTRWSDAKVVTTAPTWLQVRELLWGEIRNTVALNGHRLDYPPPNQTILRLSEGRYAIGLSTDEPTRFQGFHGGHILVILDEAPGVRAEIWEAIEGIRAGGNVHVLAIGNPTELGNPFHTIYQSQLAGWNRMTISAFDTPNLAGETVDTLKERLLYDVEMLDTWWDDNPWPMLVTRRWVGEALRNWGTDHPAWQSRVLGEFPDDDKRAVIPYSWVQAAFNRWRQRYGEGDIPTADRVSMDVGSGEEGSDKTVFAQRRGMDIIGIRKSNSLSPMEGVATLATLCANRRVSAIIDWLGIGIGVTDRARELGIRIERFIASQATEMRDKTGMFGFRNVRDASWWNVRELLNPENGSNVAIYPDDELAVELSAPTWKEAPGAKIAVESKDDIRKRIGRSTDVADAVIMAYWGSVGGGGGAKKESVWREAGVGATGRVNGHHRGKSAWAG